MQICIKVHICNGRRFQLQIEITYLLRTIIQTHWSVCLSFIMLIFCQKQIIFSRELNNTDGNYLKITNKEKKTIRFPFYLISFDLSFDLFRNI